jgi:hypothetical protein
MLSRPWPAAADPAYSEFLAENRTLILMQSILFVLSSAALIWFLGCVRARLLRAEGRVGTVAEIAFGAGLVSAGMNMTGQAAQITLTLPSYATLAPGVAAVGADLCLVTLALANIPAGVMFAAVATLSFTRRAFPVWLAWIAVLAATASLLSGLAVIPTDGPLSPLGWLTNLLRLIPLLFYVPAAFVMMRRRSESG